jgi:uncharacterized protein (DUF1499 family)
MSQEKRPARKKSWRRRIAAMLVIVGPIFAICLVRMGVISRQPDDLGPNNGQLRGCPPSPNCVSSQSTDTEHSIEPLTFDGTAEDALVRLQRVIEQMPRSTIISTDELYLHAECETWLFRFVDDVEFQIDAEAKQIQVRSASRTGYSDLGANRSRVEVMRAAWIQASER